MSKSDGQINKLITKIESVKKITENPRISERKTTQNSSNNTPSTAIFHNIVKIANSFLTNPNINSDHKDKTIVKYVKDSARVAINSSKDIIINELKTSFTNGVSDICAGNGVLTNQKTYQLSPKEFDFMNVLKVNPSSLSGSILYEPHNENGKVKLNQELFNTFSTNHYELNSVNGNGLLNIDWNSNNQVYNIQSKQNEINLVTFYDDYFDTIEYPNVDYIIKKTMLLLLHGGNDDPIDFTKGLNNLEKLINKLLSYCNILNTEPKPLKNNPTDVFNEDDVDITSFFDFNRTEGIDIDDEDSRLRRVIKFKDCDNIEIPSNSIHIEDFVYLNNYDVTSILDTLNKTSNDVTNDNNHIFYLSLINSFILKVPIALMSSILSPKMFLPFVLSYKISKDNTNSNTSNDAKTFLGKMKNIITRIVGKIFKIFIKHFWTLIKRDLLKFITKVAVTILQNKIKRYKNIVLSLITLLTKLLDTDLTNCNSIYSLINATIDGAFSTPVKIPIPGILLSVSDLLPGYSSDRAFMNCVEKLQSSGIETGTLYGEPNKLMSMIKSVYDAHTEEIDSNSYVTVSNKEIILPFGVIPPGILNSSGKIF